VSELIRAAMGGGEYDSAPAASIMWSDRGRLCAVETATGLYHGFLGSVIFNRSGMVRLSIFRGDVSGAVELDPGHEVAFHREQRDPAVSTWPIAGSAS